MPIGKRAGAADDPRFQRADDLELDRYASLEAQCAAIADDIAYNTHDIDDGLRAGLLTLDMLEDVPLSGAILAEVRDRYPRLDAVRTGHEIMRRQITRMVEDVIVTRRRHAAGAGACRHRRHPQCRPHDRHVLAGHGRGREALKAFLSRISIAPRR